MLIYWKKRKFLHKKRIQLPQDCLGTPTWPLFHCFGTPIWPPWRHVKTLYISLVRAFSTLEEKSHTSARPRYIFYFFQLRKFFPWYFLARILFPRDQSAGNFFLINHTPPPPLKTSHGRLLNNDRPRVRFINTWDLQLLFSQLWI